MTLTLLKSITGRVLVESHRGAESLAPANSWRILCYYPVRFKDLWMRYSQTMWQLLWRDKTLTTEMRHEAHLREYLGWN